MLRVFLGLDKLLEVVVKGVSELAVLTLAPELVAEGEQVCGNLVVEVEKLGVLAESVHDHLGHACVEVDPRDQPVLVDDVFKVAVSEQDELVRRCVNLLGHVGLLSRVRGLRPGLALAQDLGELLHTVGLLDAADDTVVLPDQVANH